uniref:Uncharacterized protein n=1 Tax=Anopheles dirus TaxID=7168 RepID=A0A182N8T1_9DIPT
MSSVTPERQNVSISRLKSPRTPTSPGNVASLRIETAAASIAECHQKWLQAAEKGSQYCNAVKNIKRNIQQQTAPSDRHPYPENLQLYCKNLLVMVSIMEDVAANADTVLAQVKSLHEFFTEHDTIGYTWNYRQILTTIQRITLSYKKEIDSRKYVAENIGHVLSSDQLSLFVTSWNNGIDVERDRELLIKMMIFEFKLPA